MTDDLIRVSLMIRKDQHDALREMDINISGFIRDLIDDRLGGDKIVLSVSGKTRLLYDRIISRSEKGDEEFERYIRRALKDMLADRIRQMQQLHKTLGD